MSTETWKGRVLILLTGGNIGLMVEGDSEPKPAPEEKVREMVCEAHDTYIRLHESGPSVQIRIETRDLRLDDRGKLLPPEELDSAQIKPERWGKIARVISENYENYEGFVVLHGLDTMAYTASAISFMLGNLNRPVVFAGSQRPLNYRRSDALQNIVSAITMAAAHSLGLEPVIREVTVYSYDTLFRGNRASMVNASSYRTFDSPNFPPLAQVGDHIEIQSHLLRNLGLNPKHPRALHVSPEVGAPVVILDVFPGMDESLISTLKTKDRRGVVLRTYGMGTAPTSPGVLTALQQLNDAKIVVMNVTQARSGRISYGQDPVSLRLFEQGVISGVDMTAEAALAKMVVFLSKKESFEQVSDSLQIEHCGEQSQSIFNVHFGKGLTEKDTEKDEDQEWNKLLIPEIRPEYREIIKHNVGRVNYMQLRLLGIEPSEPVSRKRLTTRIKISIVEGGQPIRELRELRRDTLEWVFPPSAKTSIATDLQSSIDATRLPTENTINRAFDITLSRDFLLGMIDSHPTATLRLSTDDPIKWKRASIAIFATAEDREMRDL